MTARREPVTAMRLPAEVRSTIRRLAEQGDTTMANVVVDGIELLDSMVATKDIPSMGQHIAAIWYYYRKGRKIDGPTA